MFQPKSVALVLAAAAAVMFGGATSHVVAQDSEQPSAMTISNERSVPVNAPETPANFASMLMWRVTETGGEFTILGPAMNQVLFEGNDCNNWVDLKEEFDFNVSYTYSDGPSLHFGNTSNPDDAKVLQYVCWIVMAQEPNY